MNREGPGLLDQLVRNTLPNTPRPPNGELDRFLHALFPAFVQVIIERSQNEEPHSAQQPLVLAQDSRLMGTDSSLRHSNNNLAELESVPRTTPGPFRTETIAHPDDTPRNPLQNSTQSSVVENESPTSESTPPIHFTPTTDDAGEAPQLSEPLPDILSRDLDFENGYFGAEDSFLDDTEYAFDDNFY
jgi:hypothetical protein